jgi:hypothetical protein
MNKFKTLAYTIAGSFVLITSCSEDFLKIDPQGQLLEVNYYTNESQCYEALIAAYDPLTWIYPWGSWFIMDNVASDEAVTGGGSSDDRPEYQEIDQHTTTPNNAAISNLWKKNYTGIYRANLLINNSNINTEEVKKYQAEAKFLRAYYYFELVRHFGDVPIITTALTEYKEKRKPATEVYAQIETDLKEAIPNLQLKGAFSSSEKFRVSVGAAQALLGKVYLFEKKWAEAAAMFAEVIKSGQYDLEPKYADNFKLSHEFGIESVFEISYTNTKPSVDAWGGPNGEGNVDIQMMGIRDLVLAAKDSTTLIQTGWGFCKPTAEAAKVFTDANDSVRLAGSFYSTAWLTSMGATFSEPYEATGYCLLKYAPMKGETNALNHDVCYTNNYRVIRYADVLLMYAEALNESGVADAVLGKDAVYYINLVRNRAKQDPIKVTDKTAIHSAIETERQLELSVEAVRYFDLVRWGKAQSVLGLKSEKGLFPIPQSEIDKSQGVLTQNEVYN